MEERGLDPARNAKHVLRRLEAATAGTQQMVEEGRYGEAYQNLMRVETLTLKAKGELQKAMIERRWSL